jgi:hypothetical protein
MLQSLSSSEFSSVPGAVRLSYHKKILVLVNVKSKYCLNTPTCTQALQHSKSSFLKKLN